MYPSFDVVNCPENRESQQRFRELLESGTCVLFVGSGSSIRLGYPSWEQALKDLSELLEDNDAARLAQQKILSGEHLLAAEIIKRKIDPGLYNKCFSEYFIHKSPSHDDFHKLLVKLKFRGFVTTNYDPVIEAALRMVQPRSQCDAVISETTKRDIHQFIKSLTSVDWDKRKLLYLHGKFNQPSTTILSYGDYVEKYDGINITNYPLFKELIAGNIDTEAFETISDLKKDIRRTQHYNTIYTIMATQRIVYFGYGLRDPYLNRIVNDVQQDFHVEYDDYHFALMSSNTAINWTKADYEMQREKWSLKGIELVFYQDNNKYTGIESFVNTLSPESFISSGIEPRQAATVVGGKSEVKAPIPPGDDRENEEVNKNLRKRVSSKIDELKRK